MAWQTKKATVEGRDAGATEFFVDLAGISSARHCFLAKGKFKIKIDYFLVLVSFRCKIQTPSMAQVGHQPCPVPFH